MIATPSTIVGPLSERKLYCTKHVLKKKFASEFGDVWSSKGASGTQTLDAKRRFKVVFFRKPKMLCAAPGSHDKVWMLNRKLQKFTACLTNNRWPLKRPPARASPLVTSDHVSRLMWLKHELSTRNGSLHGKINLNWHRASAFDLFVESSKIE